MVSERARVLFQAYALLYGEEPQGINVHGVAMAVIKMAGFLDKDLARRALHAISRMHDSGDEGVELSFEEKMLLEHRLADIDNPVEEAE